MDLEKWKSKEYQKNKNLEGLLSKLNEYLENTLPSQKRLATSVTKFPTIFIVGVPRSGTTLLTQWLASLNIFCYPTNFLSRFYKAPYVGALVQEMLFNKKYDYKDELALKSKEIAFKSDVGKTIGPLQPHEFWYFWRRFFDFPDIPVSNNEFSNKSDFKSFEEEINQIISIFNKPLFMKSLIMNPYIELFNKKIDKPIFLYIKRDPLNNIRSLLTIREKYLTNDKAWFSFKPRQYLELKKMNEFEQVAGQVYFLNKAIKKGLSTVSSTHKIEIGYEEFCIDPSAFYFRLINKLKEFDILIDEKYAGPKKFDTSNNDTKDAELISKAYQKFSDK